MCIAVMAPEEQKILELSEEKSSKLYGWKMRQLYHTEEGRYF